MKSTVVRLSHEEKRVVEYLRNPKMKENLLTDMNELIEQGVYKHSFRTLLNMIEKPKVNQLDYLIKSNFLNQEQANTMKNAIDQNKSILILGGFGTGKTVLLHALLNYQCDSNPLIKTAICDQDGEILLDSEDAREKCLYERSSSVSMHLISTLVDCDAEFKRLVLGECVHKADIMALQIGISHSCSILTTAHTKLMSNTQIKDLHEDFLIIKLSMTNGQRYVADIIE